MIAVAGDSWMIVRQGAFINDVPVDDWLVGTGCSREMEMLRRQKSQERERDNCQRRSGGSPSPAGEHISVQYPTQLLKSST